MPDSPRAKAAEQVSRHLAAALDRGVTDGIITGEQRERLLALPLDGAAVNGAAETRRGTSPLSVVTVAYGLGALLVVFACGWFLADRWFRLGAWGVLGVALGYALVLVLASRWLSERGFRVAADLCLTLVVCLTPLVAWSFLNMAGRWPNDRIPGPLVRYTPWIAWHWLVLDLATLLVTLGILRRHRAVSLTWPAAVALWGVWLHLSQALRGEDGPLGFERWIMLANGFVLLLVAERVERWQRTRGAVRTRSDVAPGDSAPEAQGDFANAFWVTGLLATTVGFLDLWARSDEAWRHLLLPISLGLVGLSLYLGRRTVLLFGVAGMLGYLAFLAGEVFRDYISFPILLAGFGILLILVTVWTQSRFPALVERIEASRRSDERALPWSAAMAVLPVFVAVVMAATTWRDGGEEQRQLDFRQRLSILQQHSRSDKARQKGAGMQGRNLRPTQS